MTQEDQAAAIGRLVLSRKEAETRLAALGSEAEKVGTMLSRLGEMFRSRPESVNFEGSPMPLEFVIPGAPTFKHADLSSQKLERLVKDIQETTMSLDKIKEQCRRAGI